MPPFALPRHPIQLIRRHWMRLSPNSYLPKLMMCYIGSLYYPLDRILLYDLQNLFLLIVFVNCCFLPPIHVSSCILCMSMNLNGPKPKVNIDTAALAIDSIFLTDCLLQHELRPSANATSKLSMLSTVWTSRYCGCTDCLTDDGITAPTAM